MEEEEVIKKVINLEVKKIHSKNTLIRLLERVIAMNMNNKVCD